jgi:hypothetical protein
VRWRGCQINPPARANSTLRPLYSKRRRDAEVNGAASLVLRHYD